MAKKKQRVGKPPPKCKALLLCDQVIIDALSKKYTLVGIFDKFGVLAFPGLSTQFTTYMQFVDGIGEYGLTVEIHDLRDDVVLARMPEIRIQFPERVNRVVILLATPPIPLPHPGTYDFVVMADGQEIDRQKFEAEQRQPPQVQQEGADDEH